MLIVRNFGRTERTADGRIFPVVWLLFAISGAAAAQTSGIPQSQDFGSVAVGGSSAAITLSYTPSGISVAPSFSLSYGLDFSAAAPSCTVAGGVSCTISVKFQPRSVGVRADAVVVKDQSGNLLGTTLLQGIGLAPQMALTPGIISTIAGIARSFGYAGDGGPATAATLANPQGVAVDSSGNIYIADSVNQVIRKVTAATGIISTVAGTGATAGLNNPTSVALDGAGNLYIADQGNSLIRKVNAVTGTMTTVAGGGNGSGGTDRYGDGGLATNAILFGPNDLALDALGNVYIADSYHGLIREVTASTGIITVVAGGGSGGGPDGFGDGGQAVNAVLDNPTGVAIDAAGNVYVADSGHSIIREINTAGIITAIAGNGTSGYSGDLGPATSAELFTPTGVRVDAGGNIYISDYGANVIREVIAASGIINTIAGTGNSSDSGDNGSATNAALATPWNLAVDATGNIYLVDPSNNVVRKVSVSSSALSFPAVNVGQASAAQLVTVSNTGNQSLSLTGLTISANFEQLASGYSDCSASSVIAAASYCFIAVASAPTVTGPLSGTLKVTGNSLNVSSSQTVGLSGTGNAAAVARVSINPSTLSFGNQNVGVVSASKTITLSNTGTASLGILSIWLSGTAASDYVMSTTCGSVLAAGASCTVSVAFSPSAAGTRSASLMFTDSVAGSPQSVAVTGVGTQVQAPPPQATFNPASLSFPAQNLGTSSSPLTVTLTNSGASSLGIAGVSLSGVNGPDFSLTTTCGATVAPGASCGFTLTFSPSAGGTRSASLSFTDNAPGSPQSIPITGTGNSVFFTQVPGALSHLSVGVDGAVWGLNNAGQIFQFNSTNQGWNFVPGSLSQVFVGSSSAVWGLNSIQQIYSRDTTAQVWKNIPGALAQLAIGCDGQVWGLNGAGNIYYFDSTKQGWQQIPGTLAQIAVGSDGAVWGLNSDNSVYRYSPSTRSFSAVSGSLTQIAVGADGDAWGLYNQSIFHFDQLSQSWMPMAGALTHIAVGSGGNVYGVNATSQICQYNAQSESCNWITGTLSQIAAAANGAVWGLDGSGAIWTLNQPTQASGVLHQMPGILSQLSIASDGSVWALDGGGSIFQFNAATGQWIQIPGNLAQIRIAPEGIVWGLNNAGQIFRFNPSSQGWTLIPGALAQLSIGANGDVWGLNSSGQIYSYNPSSNEWSNIPGILAQLSIGADGTVWGLNGAGQSYRLDPSSHGWDWVSGTFSQIAVGSKDHVWALGQQGQIYQFNSQQNAWTSVPGALSQIAVGFDGAVWGINSAHQVFRFNSQTNGWDQIAGSLGQIEVASDAVVWGLNASGSVYRFQ